MNQLPAQLLKYLADSELTLIQWDGTTNTLSFQLIKEIGPESGILTFHKVSLVQVPSWFTLQSVERQPLESQPGDWVYLLHESWGALYRVVAQDVTYEIQK